MPTKHSDLKTLRRMLKELERVLKVVPLSPVVSARVTELMEMIFLLTDDLIERTPASMLGALGGKKTAERGPDYYAKIAGMRKTKAGGRPSKRMI